MLIAAQVLAAAERMNKLKTYIRTCIRLLCSFILIGIIISSPSISSYAQINDTTLQPFTDVPVNSYAYNAINELRQRSITNGIGGNKFGYGQTVTRGEFITFLVRLMGWELVQPTGSSFYDNNNSGKFYYNPIETALEHGVISKNSGTFRPEDPITRKEAAIMLVNCLGYGTLAEKLTYLGKPFPDVTDNIGYITIANDFGIFNGTGAGFDPDGFALREQVAAILVRMINSIESPLEDLNAFYAISSSSQKDKIADLSSVCFGWSSLAYDEYSGGIVLNTDRYEYGYNDYYIPIGFTQRLSIANDAGIPSLLMIYTSQYSKITVPDTGSTIGIPEYLLSNSEIYRSLISDIISALKGFSLKEESGSFDGVAIDIEFLKGETSKNNFNSFLKELKIALDKEGKKLYVAVHPLIHPKRSSECVDGYDYREIGNLADKVILMAHDYDAKVLTQADMEKGFNITPLTPAEDIYYALKAITDPETGVQDKSKIMLQVSFNWTVWQKKDGKILNSRPLTFNLENFIKLLNSDMPIIFNYSNEFKNPYLKYTDPASGIEYTVWYENSKSVLEKIELAKLFGIRGLSLWRLGQIPDYRPENTDSYGMDIWESIINEMVKK